MGYGLGRRSGDNKAAMRSVVLTSADAHFRARLRRQLTAMRWQVREAGGGAEAMAQLEAEGAEAMVLDSVLPDLEVGEFASEMRNRHPVMDLLRVDAGADEAGPRSPRRNELLHALAPGAGGDLRRGERRWPSALAPASRGRLRGRTTRAGGERGRARRRLRSCCARGAGRPA